MHIPKPVIKDEDTEVKHILNKGFKNERIPKPVKCDLDLELIKVKDAILNNGSKNEVEIWDLLSEGDEDSVEEMRALVDFVYTYGNIEDDVPIRGCNVDAPFMKSEFAGFGTFPNGAEFYGFTIDSSGSYIPVFKIMYFNGEKLCVYTPYEGNAVNVITVTALGSEELTKESDETMQNHPLTNEIYKDVKYVHEAFNVEKYVYAYINYFEPSVKYCEYDAIDLDYRAIDDEVLRVVC